MLNVYHALDCETVRMPLGVFLLGVSMVNGEYIVTSL